MVEVESALFVDELAVATAGLLFSAVAVEVGVSADACEIVANGVAKLVDEGWVALGGGASPIFSRSSPYSFQSSISSKSYRDPLSQYRSKLDQNQLQTYTQDRTRPDESWQLSLACPSAPQHPCFLIGGNIKILE